MHPIELKGENGNENFPVNLTRSDRHTTEKRIYYLLLLRHQIHFDLVILLMPTQKSTLVQAKSEQRMNFFPQA